jgi:hypothetical protein
MCEAGQRRPDRGSVEAVMGEGLTILLSRY